MILCASACMKLVSHRNVHVAGRLTPLLPIKYAKAASKSRHYDFIVKFLDVARPDSRGLLCKNLITLLANTQLYNPTNL